jgi:hypothetical protein
MNDSNKEILILRIELFKHAKPLLLSQYSENVVNRAWLYFRAMPNESRNGRNSIEIMFESCRCAEEYERESIANK